MSAISHAIARPGGGRFLDAFRGLARQVPAGGRKGAAGQGDALRLAEQLDRMPSAVQDEIIAMFAEAAEAVAADLADAAPVSEPVTEAERLALARVGIAPDGGEGPGTPVARTAMLQTALVASARPLAEVAKAWGVTDGRLRQRLAEGTLVGVRKGRAWLIPAFQLADGGELPGLARVLRSVRRTALAVQIASFMETVQPDLVDEADAPMTPLRWLAEGRPPETVADLATQI